MAGGLFDDAYGPATATPDADSSPAPTSGPEKSGGLFDDAYGPAPDAGPAAAPPPADAPPPAGAQHKFRAPAPASPWRAAGAAPQAMAARNPAAGPPPMAARNPAAGPPPMADWNKETAGTVASHIGQNFVPSLKGTFNSFIDAVTHPVETLGTLGNVGAGVGAQIGHKLGIKQDANAQRNMQIAKAVESHYGNIYMPALHGDFRPLQNAIETDPVGTALDWSTLVGLPGGTLKAGATVAKLASSAAKAAGAAKLASGLAKTADVTGTAGKVASTVGKTVDPMTYATAPLWAAGKAAGATARGLSSLATDVSPDAFRAATAAGASPLSSTGRAFLGNMIAPDATKLSRRIMNTVNTVKGQSVNSTRMAKAALKGTQPSYQPIYDAIDAERANLGAGTKQAGLFPAAHSALDDLEQSVRGHEASAASDPAMQGLTGMDNLREGIYDAARSTGNQSARSALMGVYHNGAVQSLRDAFPGYQDVSEEAKEGMQNVRDLTQGLGTGNNATTAKTISKAAKAASNDSGKSLLAQLDAVDPTISPSLHGMSLNKLTSHRDINYGLGFLLHPVAAAKAYTISSPILNGMTHYGIGMAQGAGKAAVDAGRVGSTLGRVNDVETPTLPDDPKAFAPPLPPSEADPNDPIPKLAKAISGVESGGNYGALGPYTRDGDRAYGKYQVMGKNVGPWTQEVLGVPMSAKDFLASPEAQEAVFKAKAGHLWQKYGNAADVASVWHSGLPRAQAAARGRHDANMSTDHYAGLVDAGFRTQRASGGKISDVRRHEYLVNRLLTAAKDAKKATDKATETLLNVPDEHIVKALDVAQRAI
jgi:hypothetical protein